LNGPLGVGKTRFTQALAEAIGVDEVVNSPTFTMLNEYHSGRLPLYHFDLYRLSEGGGHTAAEMLDAELSEILSGNYLILIEWAELLEKPELSEIIFRIKICPGKTRAIDPLPYIRKIRRGWFAYTRMEFRQAQFWVVF
jgi:tRNA threonylcarbamoyladenosine biosynthesis protein TsaE